MTDDKWLAITVVGFVTAMALMVWAVGFSGAQKYKACIQHNTAKQCENVGN